MNFNFGDVLGKAWQITWKFKVLWIFGILASCGRNGGGGGGGGSSNGDGSGSNAGILLPDEVQRFLDNMEPWMVAVGVIALLLFILLMIFVVNYLSTIGRIGLVKGTVKADQGAERLTWAELLQTGGPLFWRVFWLNLLAGFVIGIVILVSLLPLIGLSILTLGIGFLCLIPLLCLLAPVSWLISIWLEQANISMIIEGSSISSALRKAWDVMKLNLGPYVVLAIGLGLIGFMIGVVAFLPVLAISVPLATGIYMSTEQALGVGAIISMVCCALYLPILLVVSGISTTFTTSTWTLTYLRLTRLTVTTTTGSDAYLEENLPSPS